MAKITYTNKVALNENPEIALINKVTDDDMNEIKSVVNTNDDNVGDITTLTTATKTSTVAAINELNSNKAKNDIVEISNTQPSSATNKLWIDTGEIGSQVSEITNEYSTSIGLGYSANYINNLSKIVWTNPNPTSVMAETTITIDDISDYDSYEIIYKTWITADILHSTGIIPKGNNLFLNVNEVNPSANLSSLDIRLIEYVSTTQLKVNYGVVQNINTDGTITITSNTAGTNGTCLPLYVIGHKTGLFS